MSVCNQHPPAQLSSLSAPPHLLWPQVRALTAPLTPCLMHRMICSFQYSGCLFSQNYRWGSQEVCEDQSSFHSAVTSFLQKQLCFGAQRQQQGMGTRLPTASLSVRGLKRGCPFCLRQTPPLPQVTASKLLKMAEMWKKACRRNSCLPQCKRSTL